MHGRGDDLLGHASVVPAAQHLAVGRGGADLEDAHEAVLAGGGDDVEAPDVPGGPGDVAHEAAVAVQLGGQVELLGGGGAQGHGVGDLLGAPDAGAVHASDDDGEGVARHALAHGVVAGLEVRVEGDLERGLLAAAGLVADGDGVELGPAVEALGLLVLVDGELGVALDQREVRVAGLGVVLDAEGQEGRARRRAQVEDGLVVVRVEAPAAAGRERRVLDPELEPAVGADRGDEVRVDGWREPLDLLEGLSVLYV